jgi:hypothetical protein
MPVSHPLRAETLGPIACLSANSYPQLSSLFRLSGFDLPVSWLSFWPAYSGNTFHVFAASHEGTRDSR